MKHKILLLLFLFSLIGCASYRKVPLTGCDHPSGWCKEIRDLAAHSWKYAQLSKNVYNKPFSYNVDDYFEKLQSFEETAISFYAVLYRDKITNEFVLVFRGTDSATDFRTGNNPFSQKQNLYGLQIYDQVMTQYHPEKICVVGHSLGGAIAINISLNRENVKAYSFNGSPVFKNKLNFNNTRYSIVEYGEILKLPRIFGSEATQEYTSIGCSKGDPITQHDMQSLATCLTRIATNQDPEAVKSLEKNKIPLED
ncbi:DUF2974 domain-containing protein [Flavobacterium tructae]|uniref:Mbeg1-like protein n=1 Tax=Flavobacterium tructae TaxID=1114873 RepID=UPI0025520333|nr:Mbeg1-like protein [Flavobacterium tructae]MDL2141726.1 DUF2974 domain-containing protein [Flavobacterium tructae]